MTPDEARTLGDKIDRAFAAVNNLEVTVGVLVAEFRAYKDAESTRWELHQAKCPVAGPMRDTATSVDAIAGIQRGHETRITELEEWRDDVDDAGIASSTARAVKMRPVSWLTENGTKVAIALLIAYLLYRFGL